MAKITVLDNPYATLWYHEESGVVHHKIHRFMPADRFKELLTAGAGCLERYKASKWLSDDGSNPVVSTEAADWGKTVWTPRAVRAGFRYWAIVLPARVIGKMQMDGFIADQRAQGVEVKTFPSERAAMKWLKSVDREKHKPSPAGPRGGAR